MNLSLFFSFFILISIISFSNCAGLYSASSKVIPLTKSNFVENVFDSPHIWMVEFYAPWCGHCKSLVPAWEAAASNLDGIVKIASVNCDEERELAGMFEVKGFPTIIFFGSEQVPNPHQPGLPWKNPEPYQGQRTAAAIANYATARLPNFVVSKNLDNFFSDNSLNKVVLFTDKKSTSNLYKALAIEYKDRLSFAQVHKSNEDLVNQYKITSFPTFIVIDNEDSHVFNGKPSRSTLINFFDPYAKAAKKKSYDKPPKPQQSEPEPDRPAELIEIDNSESFQTYCLDKRGPSVIAIFDSLSEDTDNHKSSLLEVAEKYKKQFRFLWVDGPSHSHFTDQLHLNSGYPQLLVLNPSKKAMATFIGSFDVSGISHFLDKVLLGSRRTIQQLETLPTFE